LELNRLFVEGQSRVLHAIRTSGFFAMIGMLVALAFIFDHPFVGASQISGGAEDTFANCKE
jgi:hypothetical protein